MKTTIKFIVAVITLHVSFCKAQQADISPTRWLSLQKKVISITPFIFEGTVIKQEHFIAPNHELMTCNVLSITKIFKGSPQIKLGTIKIILDDGESEENGMRVKIDDWEEIMLNKGATYIVFSTPRYSNVLDSVETDNKINLTTDIPVWLGKSTAQWGQSKYNTLDSLYSFLKENGLTVQEEVQSDK